MIQVDRFKVDGNIAWGLKVDLPDSPPLVAILCEKGFIMCGLLNTEAAEKLDVAAAMVSGVKDFDDMFAAEVKSVTSRAEKKGVKRGINGYEAAKLLF